MSAFHPARAGDAAAVDAFLASHSDTSMFLRANVRAHGVCGGAAGHATTIWLNRASGAIAGVVGLTTGGMVLVQMPAAPRRDFGRAARALHGAAASGMTGEARQVRNLLAAAGLAGARAALDDDQPLYALDLSDLQVPAGPETLRPAEAADLALLAAWRAAYHVESLGTEQSAACERGHQEAAVMIERRLCRILERAGVPVGMTALNAALAEAVQVGGVYTPPEVRGQGVARRAVALHLEELRRAGVGRAVLFASGRAACRAYEAIGFRRTGTYAIVLFAPPAVIAA